MGYGIDFISIHLERGEGLYPRILYSDVIFCLQAGGPVTGRGGGSEVRGGRKSGREANTSSSGQYLVPHLSISRG